MPIFWSNMNEIKASVTKSKMMVFVIMASMPETRPVCAWNKEQDA